MTSTQVSEGDPLWTPGEDLIAESNLTRYTRWLASSRGLRFEGYTDLHAWSVTDPGAFWETIWEFFEVKARAPYSRPLGARAMPGAEWFPGAKLNYAEHALAGQWDHAAVIARAEGGAERQLSHDELRTLTARVQAGLRDLGVGPGDRVVSYLPNVPETLAAFLAAAGLGAVWSSCAPEFGAGTVLDRFRQIEPKVMLVVDGYRYGGKPHGRLEAVAEIRAGLPSLEATVVLPVLGSALPEGAMAWDDLLGEDEGLHFEPVAFDHPLWILYSSGTTGLPKAIVQGHGGILLEHLKVLSLHSDLKPGDRFFWFTTTGWMMWNYLIGGLLVGTTVVMYDGNPAWPGLSALWEMASEVGLHYFGTSAAFILACRKMGLRPGERFDLSKLKGVGSTGAPLPAEGFEWVYEAVGRDLLLASVAGGTDVCTAFVLSCPHLPVRAGEIQCAGLGCKVEAFDSEGRPVVGEVGELVLTEPMPSMPLYFWGDPEGARHRASYFEVFPGTWRHGDWVKHTPEGGFVIYGRSDSTLNRGGVRMGTSEFYRVVDTLPEVIDSLVVDTGSLDSPGHLLLFVVLAEGADLDRDLTQRLRSLVRASLSPRHVPDAIHQIPSVPRTLSGKKIEVPIKRILNGTPPEEAMKRDTLANPGAVEPFLELARTLRSEAAP